MPPFMQKRPIRWLVFWTAFFAGPALALLAAKAGLNGGILAFPFLGALIAGFALSAIFAKTNPSFIVWGILFSFGMVVVYCGILFIGCLIILPRNGF